MRRPYLKTISRVDELRLQVGRWKARGLRTALVPTMGALHDGHLTLIAQGLRRADKVVATIFVNPKQFGPSEDLDRYPRDEAGDFAKLRSHGCHAVFVPEPTEMYPDGFCTTVSLGGPAKAGLEDKFRPDFFNGVATVVAKLFIQAGCDYAMFGEKDYQQLKVVTRMARDLDIPTTVVGVPTVREPDGLAMSSRNAYLSPEERALAPMIHRALTACAEAIGAGGDPDEVCASARHKLDRAGFKVDYLAARHAENLGPLASPRDSHEPVRLLCAAWLGKTRLIDNIGL